MTKEKLEPAEAQDSRATTDDNKNIRREKKVIRLSTRLARYAIKEANEGHIDEPLSPKIGPLSVSRELLQRYPEIYDRANEVLAEQGLRVTQSEDDTIHKGFYPNNYHIKRVRIQVLPEETVMSNQTTPHAPGA